MSGERAGQWSGPNWWTCVYKLCLLILGREICSQNLQTYCWFTLCNNAIQEINFNQGIKPARNRIKVCFMINRKCTSTLHCIRGWFIIFCIVLYWRGGHCCPMHCDLFKIYCVPPNPGILKFAQRYIFSSLRFFKEHEISDSGPPA